MLGDVLDAAAALGAGLIVIGGIAIVVDRNRWMATLYQGAVIKTHGDRVRFSPGR